MRRVHGHHRKPKATAISWVQKYGTVDVHTSKKSEFPIAYMILRLKIEGRTARNDSEGQSPIQVKSKKREQFTLS
jgi:hypothetical protein